MLALCNHPQLYHLPGFYEPFSAISHLFGAVLFSILGYLLLRRGRGDRTRITLLGVYVFSSVLLMSMSGVYHMMVRGGSAHHVFERLDHSSIVIFIAGTFTAAHGLVFDRHHRWLPLAFVWIVAATGVTLRAIFFEELPEEVGLVFYLALGWVGFGSVIVLWRRYSFRFVSLLLWGGLAYSIGAVCEYLRWPVPIAGVIHSHEVFHIAALIGALCHWFFLWEVATGELPLPRERPALLTDAPAGAGRPALAEPSVGAEGPGDVGSQAEIDNLRRQSQAMLDRAAGLTAEAERLTREAREIAVRIAELEK
jgi:channel protein (hemolysin III family)